MDFCFSRWQAWALVPYAKEVGITLDLEKLNSIDIRAFSSPCPSDPSALMKVILYILVVMHWVACGWHLLADLEDADLSWYDVNSRTQDFALLSNAWLEDCNDVSRRGCVFDVADIGHAGLLFDHE